MKSNPFETPDRRILAESGTSDELEKTLYALCDDIGPRFAGTDGYRRAADFMLEKFKGYGVERAELEPFQFMAWRRGEPAEFSLWPPRGKNFVCYELPYGATTGADGIVGELVDIGTGDEKDFERFGDDIRGRLVLVTRPGGHRMDAYARCVNRQAAGFVLGNSLPGMMVSTGSVTNAKPGAIPAVAIPSECVRRIQRLLKNRAETCRFHLRTNGSVAKATTWNVVAELPGSEFPDEWVVVGGHLDSHDIGPCAYDNGAGAVMVLEVARLLAAVRKGLKRSVRFIHFAGEEIGLLGSHHHARTHAKALRKARFMLNCDMPALGRPRGLAFHECSGASAYMDTLSAQMRMPLVCQNRSHRHSDHYPFILQGLPTAGVGGGTFGPQVQHFVHMAADTPEKISTTDLADCAAFAARFLLRAANDPQWPDMRRTAKEIEDYG